MYLNKNGDHKSLYLFLLLLLFYKYKQWEIIRYNVIYSHVFGQYGYVYSEEKEDLRNDTIFVAMVLFGG